MNRKYALSKTCFLNETTQWWNKIFNRAYKQFDDIRVQLVNGFDTLNIVENVYSGDEKMDNEVLELLSYMFKNYSYDLSEEQEIKYRILSKTLKAIYIEKRKEINLISEPRDSIEKKSDSDNTIESYKNEILKLKQENKELKQQQEKDPNVMTCSQQTMAFLYLLNHVGINTDNTKKSTIARFMQPIIGRNEANIRKRLEFNYDDLNVKQNLRIVANTFTEILPSTAEQILKDIEG